MDIPYALNEPFPKGIYKRASALPLRYFDYPVFSWPWCWHRAKIFLPIVLAIPTVFAAAVAFVTKDWKVGAIEVAINCIPAAICIVLGPALAANVRSRQLCYRLERRLIIASLILTVALGMVAGKVIFALTFDYFQTQMAARGFVSPVMTYRPMLWQLVNAAMGLVFLVWFVGAFALREHAYEHRFWQGYLRQRETDLMRQQRDEAHRKLTVLQAQVEPHFLYNTLASVRSLVQSDPLRAEATIDALVDHLRASLPKLRTENGSNAATLAEQLEICRSYLDVMCVRMGERLRYAIDVPKELREVEFPPLMLISLVENAIKHGVEPKPGPCQIQIAARQTDHAGSRCLAITVSDDGAGLREGPSEGVGLANIRAQLATRYGDRASVVLTPKEQGGVVASLVVPLDNLPQ
jgi:two-component sensor histidine kinase